MVLEQWWSKHERFWVTFKKQDAVSNLVDERVYWCHHPTNRNLPNLIRNAFLAWRILRRERPHVVISTGAAVAVPFFYLAKLLGMRTVYLEVYDRIGTPSLTGRLVYPVCDKFLIQWKEQKLHYPKAELVGELL